MTNDETICQKVTTISKWLKQWVV